MELNQSFVNKSGISFPNPIMILSYANKL